MVSYYIYDLKFNWLETIRFFAPNNSLGTKIKNLDKHVACGKLDSN